MGGRYEPWDMLEWDGDRYVLEDAEALHGYSLADIEWSLREQDFRERESYDFDILLLSMETPVKVGIDLEDDCLEVYLGSEVATKTGYEGIEKEGLFRMKEIELHEALEMGHTFHADSVDYIFEKEMEMLERRKESY